MAIKLKKISVDIDLDLTDKGLGLLKAIKKPSAKEFITWATEAQAKQDKMGENAKKDFDAIIAQLDYWYEKGYEFWANEFNMPELISIIEAITEQVSTIQKK